MPGVDPNGGLGGSTCLSSIADGGKRFRPATIQEEARRLSLAVAKRKNWTLEQMADRGIPSAGLDDKGELRLSYGTRNFVARLNAHLEFVVTDGAGKSLKALPAVRKSDDETQASESRQEFSTARKESEDHIANSAPAIV